MQTRAIEDLYPFLQAPLKSLAMDNVELYSNNVELFNDKIPVRNCPALETLEELKLTNCSHTYFGQPSPANPEKPDQLYCTENEIFFHIGHAPALKRLEITENPNEPRDMVVTFSGNCPNLQEVILDTKYAQKNLLDKSQDARREFLCEEEEISLPETCVVRVKGELEEM